MENKIICVVGILLLIVAIIYFYRSQEQFKGSKPKGKSCNQMAVESCKTVRGQQHLTCVTDAKKQCPPKPKQQQSKPQHQKSHQQSHHK